MYTLLSLVSIIVLVLTVLAFFGGIVAGPIHHSDLKRKGQYTSLYNREEIEEASARADKLKKFAPAFLTAAFMLLIGGILLTTYTSHQLARVECAVNDGQFLTWDHGFGWECYNPNQIDQDNNFRILSE